MVAGLEVYLSVNSTSLNSHRKENPADDLWREIEIAAFVFMIGLKPVDKTRVELEISFTDSRLDCSSVMDTTSSADVFSLVMILSIEISLFSSLTGTDNGAAGVDPRPTQPPHQEAVWEVVDALDCLSRTSSAISMNALWRNNFNGSNGNRSSKTLNEIASAGVNV